MKTKMENKKNIKKRQRSENWLEEDKNLLMDLVRERISIIENKNTDTNTNSKKQATWADLLNSFNFMCKGGTRTIAQLKSQWSIIKMTKKKLKSDERKKLLQTGGSPPPLKNPENADDICSWLPNESSIDNNDYDSDKPSSSKEPTKKENVDKASAAERIASVETACRKELHEVQMANEERRARNLDLEESLFKVKIDFFRKRIQLLENDNK